MLPYHLEWHMRRRLASDAVRGNPRPRCSAQHSICLGYDHRVARQSRPKAKWISQLYSNAGKVEIKLNKQHGVVGMVPNQKSLAEVRGPEAICQKPA